MWLLQQCLVSRVHRFQTFKMVVEMIIGFVVDGDKKHESSYCIITLKTLCVHLYISICLVIMIWIGSERQRIYLVSFCLFFIVKRGQAMSDFVKSSRFKFFPIKTNLLTRSSPAAHGYSVLVQNCFVRAQLERQIPHHFAHENSTTRCCDKYPPLHLAKKIKSWHFFTISEKIMRVSELSSILKNCLAHIQFFYFLFW